MRITTTFLGKTEYRIEEHFRIHTIDHIVDPNLQSLHMRCPVGLVAYQL
jgi:hypothetical protein